MPTPQRDKLYQAVAHDPDLKMFKKFNQGGGGAAHAGMIRWWGAQGVCANMCMDFHRALSQNVSDQWLGHTFTPAIKRLQGATEFAIRFETLQSFPEYAQIDPMFSATRGETPDKHIMTTPTGTATHLYNQEHGASLDEIASLLSSNLNTKADSAGKEKLINSLRDKEMGEVITSQFAKLDASDEALQHDDLHFTLSINFETPAFGHAVAITANPNNPDTLFILDPNTGIIEAPKTKEGLKKGLEFLITKTYPEPDFKVHGYNVGLQIPHWFADRKAPLAEPEIQALREKEKNLFGTKHSTLGGYGPSFSTNKSDYSKIYTTLLASQQQEVDKAGKFTFTTIGTGDDEWDLLEEEEDIPNGENPYAADKEVEHEDDFVIVDTGKTANDEHEEEEEWTVIKKPGLD